MNQNKLQDASVNGKPANRLQCRHLCLCRRKLPLTQSLLYYTDKSLLFQQSTSGTSIIKPLLYSSYKWKKPHGWKHSFAIIKVLAPGESVAWSRSEITLPRHICSINLPHSYLIPNLAKRQPKNKVSALAVVPAGLINRLSTSWFYHFLWTGAMKNSQV